jgi:hypothetical protein
LDHLVAECQAAGEEFTGEYYKLEAEQGQVMNALSLAVETLATFMLDKKDYIKNGWRLLRNRTTMTEEDAANLETNLRQIELEQTNLQKNVDTLKNKKDDMEAAFQVEVNKPENSKNFGQPLRAFIDDVLQKYSIDRAVQHGGKLEGNQCQKLLTKSSVILMEIQEYVCSRPPECRIVGTNADIEEVFHWHHVLLVALDGLFSGLRTTRYKVNDKILDETVKFRDRVLQISRYLGEFVIGFVFLVFNLLFLISLPLFFVFDELHQG